MTVGVRAGRAGRSEAPDSGSRSSAGSRRLRFLGLLLLLGLPVGAAVAAGPPVRVAVAPFVGDRPGLPVADALAARLARRPIERLIAPDAFVARPDFDVRAAEVRQWAYNAAVDAVVVGRLLPSEGGRGEPGVRVEAALRSGHSGAELARHAVTFERAGGLGAAVERLAASLLEDLGFREEAPAPAVPGPPAARPEAPRGRGTDTSREMAGFRGDEPIAIEADEAEIVERGERREIVFQRNVHVRQGSLSVRSDWLEAEYRRGESEPTRLVARGAVRVDQGDRKARCDRAVYMQATQTVICEGRAELVQGCDIVRGERIEFDLARDRARVEGAASILILPGAREDEGEGEDEREQARERGPAETGSRCVQEAGTF